METRTLRSRRAAASRAPSSDAGSRSARSTRQTTIPASVTSDGPSRGTRQRQSPRPREWMGSQIPRRGARLSGRAESIVSLTTNRGRADDDTEYEYEEEEDDRISEVSQAIGTDVGNGVQHSEGIQHLEDIQVGQSISNADDNDEDENTRHQIMVLTIQDLAKASDGLMDLLRQANYGSAVFNGLLDLRRNLFRGIRVAYQEPNTEPFIDWSQLLKRYETMDSAAPTAITMARANVVTALDELRNIQLGHQMDPFPLLSKLNELFPGFFVTSEDTHKDLELALDIRTWYFIEALAGQEKEPDTYALLAEVFCLPKEGMNYVDRFIRGPFRKLWDVDEDETQAEELCSQRIMKIIPIMKNKNDYGIAELRQVFPFKPLMEKLEVWLVEIHASLGDAGKNGSARSSVQLDDLPAVEEEVEVADSQTDIAESQPIVRAGTVDGQPSLFFGATSLGFLNGQTQGPPSVPPSNQQQAAPAPGAPRDYPEHSNKDLLRTPQPESSLYPRSQPQGSGSSRTRKRATEEEDFDQMFAADEEAGEEVDEEVDEEAEEEADEEADEDTDEEVGEEPEEEAEEEQEEEADEEDDDDDEGEFETDTRPVKQGKRAAIVNSMPPPKRPRISAPPSSSRPIPTSSRDPPSTGRAPPLSTISEEAPVVDPNTPDFAALSAQKRDIVQRNRAMAPPAYKQRYVWSHQDTATLITLIRDRQAAWSAIEKKDNHLFEHPRNQQAYRDKARNMKVDLLITDAVLPPGFDMVKLGRKEIDKLIGLGKNPYRRETDVDEDGNAVGTEYADYGDFD